jgi:hypothetical protein
MPRFNRRHDTRDRGRATGILQNLHDRQGVREHLHIPTRTVSRATRLCLRRMTDGERRAHAAGCGPSQGASKKPGTGRPAAFSQAAMAPQTVLTAGRCVMQSRASPSLRLTRPQRGLRLQVFQIFEDLHRVENLEIAVHQHRHLPLGVDTQHLRVLG